MRRLMFVLAVLLVAACSAASHPLKASAGSHKVMVIVEENHSRSDAMAGMPYLAGLAAAYGQATGYYAVDHPSLPNYLAIWGGSEFGVGRDCDVGQKKCLPSPPSVWGQALAAGETAGAYQESMASNCDPGGSSTSDAVTPSSSYAPRHGPWPYWLDAAERGYCQADDVDMGLPSSGRLYRDIQSGSLPAVGEMTPNLCDDAHDCPLSVADNWLSQWVPVLMGGPDYTSGNLTIIITFDEGSGSVNGGGNVAFVVTDPRLSGVTVSGSTVYTHYSLTRWLDDNAGLPELRNAAAAPDLKAAFGL